MSQPSEKWNTFVTQPAQRHVVAVKQKINGSDIEQDTKSKLLAKGHVAIWVAAFLVLFAGLVSLPSIFAFVLLLLGTAGVVYARSWRNSATDIGPSKQ